jgi:outer membrane protein insertion porin family
LSKKLFVALPLLLLAVQAWCQTALVVRQVTVSGNANISSDAILQAAKITVGRPASTADLLNAEDAVRNLGYFKDAKILSRAVSDTETDVTIEVVEYPVIREFQFLGNTVVSTEELTKLVAETVEPGLVWSNRNARPIRDAVVKLYEDRGYFVQLDRIEPSEESPGTLTIGVIEPTVNEIRLVGLDKTRESTVRRVMKTRPGRPLSARTWRRDMEELYYTYWFETITPANPEPTEVPGQYNLTVEFKEARTGQLNAGVALDPQSRLVGTASYSDSNFRGLGQSVGIQLSQATVGGRSSWPTATASSIRGTPA